MDPVSLGALRNYAQAQKALSPDTQKLQVTPPESDLKPNAVSEAAQEFAAVFDKAETAAQAMSVGKADAHSVVEALATAELALETAVTVRDKVIEAYQELLRMPV